MSSLSVKNNIYDTPEYWCGDIGYREPGYGDFALNTIKEIAILLRKPLTFIDIGCAYGYTPYRMAALGIPAVGMDVSSLAISRRAKPHNSQYVVGTVWAMPFKTQSIEFGYCSGVLEHIPKRYLKRSIKEIIRVCSRGLIAVSCTDDPTTIAGADETHEIEKTLDEWASLFPSNFEVISDSMPSWRILATRNTYQMLS